MKINFKTILIAAFLVTAPLLMLAQPHPNNGAAPGGGNTPVGGSPSAPVGSGAGILITLALAYGAERWYSQKKKNVQE